MALTDYLRDLVRPFLVGSLRSWWIKYATKVFARRYARHLVITGSRPFGEPARLKSYSTILRRLVFISDILWERRELVPELEKICEVDLVDVRGAVRLTGPKREFLDIDVVSQISAKVAKNPSDATIVYLRSSLLSSDIFDLTRSFTTGPVIGMNLDDKMNFEHLELLRRHDKPYREWAGRFDCNLSNSQSAMDLYNCLGLPCLYIPTGFHFDPDKHAPKSIPGYEFPISFVGSRKPERAHFVEQIRKLGIKIALFGNGWSDGTFTNEGWRIYQRSQINLGIGYNVNGNQITNLKNRDFECPGAGGCYLTTFDWELAQLFAVGREILCYRDIYDFAEIWAFYSRRPESCQRIARAGQTRAIREHTWEARFREAFRKLGFKLP